MDVNYQNPASQFAFGNQVLFGQEYSGIAKELEDYRKRINELKNKDTQAARKLAEEYTNQFNQKFRFGGLPGNREAVRNALMNVNREAFGAQGGGYNFLQGNFEDWKQLQNLFGNPNLGSERGLATLAQEYQRGVAGQRATRFAENLPQYIAQETSSLQQALGEKMGQARRNLLGEMNRRGLLRSGQRGMGEVNLASQFAGQFEQGRADVYRKAQEEAQRLFTNPTLQGLGYDAQALDVQNRLQQMKDQDRNARNQLFGGAMGMIGQGVGGYLGGMRANTPQAPTSVPTATPSTGMAAQPFRKV